jgi:hypothetical protein
MSTTEDILLRARALIRVGRRAEAHNLLRALLNQQRDNAAAWRLMVRVARSQEEAIFCLKHVLRLNPGDEWAVNTLLKLRDLHPERPASAPARRTLPRPPEPPDSGDTIEAVSFLEESPPPAIEEEPAAEPEPETEDDDDVLTVLTAGAEVTEAEASVFFEEVSELDDLLGMTPAEATPFDDVTLDLGPEWLGELPSEPRYPIPDWDSITDSYPRPELVEKAGRLRAGRMVLVAVLMVALVAGTVITVRSALIASQVVVPAIRDAHATTKNALIMPGTQVTDRTEGTFDAHNYLIDLSEGQQISLRVEGIDGANPEVFLYAPEGDNALAYDDASGDGRAALSMTVPKEGRYIIRVRLWEPGTYRLIVQ